MDKSVVIPNSVSVTSLFIYSLLFNIILGHQLQALKFEHDGLKNKENKMCDFKVVEDY